MARAPKVRNPLEPPDSATRERIRLRAYHLWEQDGRPEGRAEEYWERARELQAMADAAGAGQLPNPEKDPKARRQVVEEAEIQENLGEFTDRGERQETPLPRKQARRKLREG
jgi:hypothetical protein